MSGKRACSYLPECRLSSAKRMKGECNSKSGKRSFTRLDTAEPHLIFCKDTPNCVHYKIMRFIFRAIMTVFHAFCVVSRYVSCFVTE